jgi:hypothetical protein
MRVRVMYYHMVEQRRDLVGTVVARYGGEDYSYHNYTGVVLALG